MKQVFLNSISTLIFISILYFFYVDADFFESFRNGSFIIGIFSFHQVQYIDVIHAIIGIYSILLIPFYWLFPTQSKAYIIFSYLGNIIRKGYFTPDNTVKYAILAWGVKGFFAPLLIFWFFAHLQDITTKIIPIYQNIFLNDTSFYVLFQNYLFLFAFAVILGIDVLFFTLGYLLEGKIFKNEIKSVDPFFSGWIVCLMCYPPFNSYSGQVLKWYSSDFPQFSGEFLQIFFNVLILILMGLYAWASVNLGLKASNLTNRGIVKTGMYKYIRHPAYITKNLAWWIGGLPILIGSFSNQNYGVFFAAIFSLTAWSGVYYLRAITEERHLSLDNEYRKYKKEVPNRFFPSLGNK